ncbi:hypothetical protein BDA96_06G013100 [Sorghum bicolor]|uniref:Uncharacterized protein n=1 Tax=Sorghum bicolor TaxID=4558 RepID=A0A921UAY5_SORBI|nr:hypothetical protein BDA96_06G013100 [Sorghum bicolor]
MDEYHYPNLTIVEEDVYIKFRINQLRHAIIAEFPQHEPHNITAETIQAATQMQYGVHLDLQDISQFTSGFLLEIRPQRTRKLMLTKGFIAMSPFSLNLVPWNPEYGSTATLAYTQLPALSNFDHNAYARNSGRPLKQIHIQIAGIPPHLCSNATINTLLAKLAIVRHILLNPKNHTYIIHADTHCFDAIPPTANLGIKRMQEGKLLFHIWPIWYNTVDITPPDALSSNHARQRQQNIPDDEAHSALRTPDDTTYWARNDSTEYEPGYESDRLQ